MARQLLNMWNTFKFTTYYEKKTTSALCAGRRWGGGALLSGIVCLGISRIKGPVLLWCLPKVQCFVEKSNAEATQNHLRQYCSSQHSEWDRIQLYSLTGLQILPDVRKSFSLDISTTVLCFFAKPLSTWSLTYNHLFRYLGINL